MGVFASGMQAEIALNKLKSGKPANLSYAQVSNLIINLADAKRNLSSDLYAQVFKLWEVFQSNNTKVSLNSMDDYYLMAIEVIKQFDRIAPYEKYSGANGYESSLLIDAIRSNNTNERFKEDLSTPSTYKQSSSNKICRKCGNRLLAQDIYCGKCGTKYEIVSPIVERGSDDLIQEILDNIEVDTGTLYNQPEYKMLYTLEHQVLPELFFNNPIQVASGIGLNSEKLYYFFSGAYDYAGIKHVYAKDDYKSICIPFYNKIIQEVMVLPDPTNIPLCKQIVIFHDFEKKDKLAYYTVEKTFEGFVLCAWMENGIHANMGPINLQNVYDITLQYYCSGYNLDNNEMIRRLPSGLKRYFMY